MLDVLEDFTINTPYNSVIIIIILLRSGRTYLVQEFGEGFVVGDHDSVVTLFETLMPRLSVSNAIFGSKLKKKKYLVFVKVYGICYTEIERYV